MSEIPWQFWIDVGGTFTDCIGRDPQGNLHRSKVLSSGIVKGTVGTGSTATTIIDPQRREPAGFWTGCRCVLIDSAGNHHATSLVQEHASGGVLHLAAPLPFAPEAGTRYELHSGAEAPLLAIRQLLGCPWAQLLPPCDVRLGTTRGTNALLTRSGPPTAFITTRGLGDILRIGYQNRPDLFALTIRKPSPLFALTGEVDERLSATGDVIVPLDEEQTRRELARLRSAGAQTAAICLLHAVVNTAHETRVAELAREAGFAEVVLSSQTAPRRKIVPRGDTTVVDAYLAPVLRDYLARLTGDAISGRLRLLTSAGGLTTAEMFRGQESVLSGPAGGVVGMAAAARSAGFTQAIGFDMGGTSTDVSLYRGEYDYEFETEKAGVRLVTPMLAIETVAAGGGSICRFDGARLLVGPESAGADPGPACYGRGGPLTITDVNLYLGRIDAERFPFRLDLAAVEQRLESLAAEVRQARGEALTLGSLAAGLLDIANATMARAIRSVSIAKGRDPREYVLVAFGGASGQHAAAVAEEMGMTQVLLPNDASLLSARGAGLADVVAHRSREVFRPLVEFGPTEWSHVWDELQQAAAEELRRESPLHVAGALRVPSESSRELNGIRSVPTTCQWRRFAELRYQGVDAPLVLECTAELTLNDDWQQAFAREHRERFGYVQPGRPLELVRLRVEGRSPSQLMAGETIRPESAAAVSVPATPRQTRVYAEGDWQAIPLLWRTVLSADQSLSGPALLGEEFTCTFVPRGWVAERLADGAMLLTKRTSQSQSAVATTAAQEVFHHRLSSIAEQMGHALRTTACSVNVKERLDFSCALFAANGDLIVNAPHIPVHLGAMSETIRALMIDRPRMFPGDVYATNDPYRGGSHLPDVTVVTPVFIDDPISATTTTTSPMPPAFFVASRAHHAEIGGVTPGSMPPFSRNLAEEGVLLRNVCVIERGQPRWDQLRRLLTESPYPSRAVEDNLADIHAQIAANQQGVAGLRELVARHSLAVVQRMAANIRHIAEQKVRQALARLADGRRTFRDHLDDGTPIVATVDIRGDTATIDFTGTGNVLPTNLNANRAITKAAVMYVLRLLVGEDVPLNEGLLAPVTLRLPECLLNPRPHDDPQLCAAIVGGNVETSQRVVDVLLGAFGLAAASQGTMNNFLFGATGWGYYETICGGSGATAVGPGADAVQVHMTNTRMTDPEVLEARFPVRLWEFSIRCRSGGEGEHRGGDGVRRRVEFLAPVTASLLTQRRGENRPYGMVGGEPGESGRNVLVRRTGETEQLPSSAQVEMQPGDQIVIETPGGGGWGVGNA